MAPVTVTGITLLCCLSPMALGVPSPVVPGQLQDNRVPVPVHRGGAPVVASDRQGRPKSSYASQSYQPQTSYYQEEENLLPYVLPALAITGLSLLFPNIVTVNTAGRRKRDTSVSEAPINELSEHMMNIYMAAMESDECLQRIACEVGAVSKSFKSNNFNTVMTVLGSTTSSKYSKLFEKFKYGMNSEKCEMIGCALLDQ